VRVDTVHRVFTTKSLSKKRAREHSFTFFYEEKTFAGVSLVIQGSAGRPVVGQQIKLIAHAHAPGISIMVSNGKDPYALPSWFADSDALRASISMASCWVLPAGMLEEAGCRTAKWRGAVREEVRQLS
jgi:hypothetical protein